MAERTQRLDRTTQAMQTMEWDVETAIEHEQLEAQTARQELVLGRYRLGRKLGSGGFGTVYAARDERLRRDVAIKVIPREQTDDDRAGREARVAARLNHPNVVALYELGCDDDSVYLVSELVAGRTLADLIGENALSDRDVARIGAALCDGLAHAHERGVIHRDIKPGNVMVVDAPARGSGFAKLTDFGVAHLAGDEPLTRTGDVVGTLAYMAPEQAEGQRVTWEADVYSLALTLYEAWTGVNPVRRRGPAATARQLGKPIPSLGKERRDLPPDLVAAIDLALDPQPQVRPGPDELAVVLRDLARELSDEGALEEEELRPGKRFRLRVSIPERLLAAAGIGLLTYVALVEFAPPLSYNPAAAAGIAAAAALLLPRLAWIVTVLLICCWLAMTREGSGVVLLAACLPIPFLLVRSPSTWSLPALAPALALPGLGPAYPAVAGQTGTWARRAALGAIGWLWLALAEAAFHGPLLFGPVHGQRARSYWMDDGWRALGHAIEPIFASPLALGALAFALAAVLLPLLVRGIRLPLDLIGALVWGGALYAAFVGIERLAGPGVHARGAAAGAALGAVIAVTAAAIRRRRGEVALGSNPVP